MHDHSGPAGLQGLLKYSTPWSRDPVDEWRLATDERQSAVQARRSRPPIIAAMCRKPETMRTQRLQRGFSLIELMIAVAVVALLATVAYPSYLSSIRKGRRAEAVSALTGLQQAQERWRANHQSYTTALSSLNSALPDTRAVTSPGGYYGLAIDSASATGYLMTAQAQSGTSQASDTSCKTLRMQFYNGAIFYGGCNGCSTPVAGGVVTDPNNCWAK